MDMAVVSSSLCSSPFGYGRRTSVSMPRHLRTKEKVPVSWWSFQYACRQRLRWSRREREVVVKLKVMAYIEKQNGAKEIAENIIASLPVVGLLYRLINAEGGVGGERLQLPEFCKRVEKRCTPQDARAFYDFRERHGKRGNPRFVLLWCWVAALGAGLVKSEDILLGASRLRVSFDIQYEEEIFNILMDDAAAKRAKSKAPLPEIPIKVRAEKALEAICKCCLGSDVLEEEEDAMLLNTMLCAVFPTADKAEIERIVWSKMKQSPIDEETNQDIVEQETEEPITLEQDTETVYN